MEVDVIDASGFAREAAFVKVFDVAVIPIEKVQDVEGNFPVSLSIANP